MEVPAHGNGVLELKLWLVQREALRLAEPHIDAPAGDVDLYPGILASQGAIWIFVADLVVEVRLVLNPTVSLLRLMEPDSGLLATLGTPPPRCLASGPSW